MNCFRILLKKRNFRPTANGFLLVGLLCFFTQCSDKELKLLPDQAKPNGSTSTKDCLLKKAVHSQSFYYDFKYNSSKKLTEIDGFPDFDLIEYKGDLPVKVVNSLDKSYHIDFGYDTQNNLKSIIFYGKDALSLPFEFRSTVYTNTKKQINKIDLALPVFDGTITTNIEYDTKGNIIKITKTEKGKTSIVLENQLFDTKKSPYLKTSIGNIMMYFILYTAILGGENNTFFINPNNPSTAIVNNNLGEKVEYAYKYIYNPDDYPMTISTNRKVKTKGITYDDTFEYDCK